MSKSLRVTSSRWQALAAAADVMYANSACTLINLAAVNVVLSKHNFMKKICRGIP